MDTRFWAKVIRGNSCWLWIGARYGNGYGHVGRNRHVYKPTQREKNGNAKLTEAQVAEIRKLAGEGVTQTELARMYGLVQPHVSRIVRKENWA